MPKSCEVFIGSFFLNARFFTAAGFFYNQQFLQKVGKQLIGAISKFLIVFYNSLPAFWGKPRFGLSIILWTFYNSKVSIIILSPPES